MVKLLWAFVLIGVTVLGMSRARAAAPDAKTREAVRQLGSEGIRLYDAAEYGEALDRFTRANKLITAPTLQLRIARSLVKLGRLVEASDMYLEAIRFQTDRSSPPLFYQAQKDAKLERELLLPRIPKLRVVVTGPVTERTVVLLDGNTLPAELYDTLVPVNPGKHEVRVRREDITVTRTATVAEGAAARVEVAMPPRRDTPQERAAVQQATQAKWRAGAIASFVVGGVGVLAFAINGGVALALKADLDKRCPERNCQQPDTFGTLDAYEITRVATTVGLVVAGVGLATGTTLWLLRPKAPAAPAGSARATVAVKPYFGPLGAGTRIVW